MAGDPKRDAAYRAYYSWYQSAQKAVWAGQKIPRIPTPPKDAEYSMADVSNWVEQSLGVRFSDGRGNLIVSPDEAWNAITGKITEEALTEATHLFEEAQAAKRAEMVAPTRKRGFEDLDPERFRELNRAVESGTYPAWIDDPAVDAETRTSAWKILPDQIKLAYREDHTEAFDTALEPPAEPATEGEW